jgi:hypothetical protein
MPKVVVNEFVSLDGVAQAPGQPDEDRSGDFAHGGWHMPYMEDEVARKSVLSGLPRPVPSRVRLSPLGRRGVGLSRLHGLSDASVDSVPTVGPP